ncbi:leucine-rich repeat protein [Butyrivibrio sp. MC2021]|uniref:leucine-rich repeat protein n=1 Tax=Butyrivibrio sp. MC2021 TaxID=1408306 RepID=UPI0009DDB664|nr:leucine-rich repeat protein [Butyrivibrio sp. MC2021]
MKMKKALKQLLCMMLSTVLVISSLNLKAFAMEEGQEPEEVLLLEQQEKELEAQLETLGDEEKFPEGYFGFGRTAITLLEGEDGVIEVLRAGNKDTEASVTFKAVDVSSEYGKDYTLSVTGGFFGDKTLDANPDAKPLMQEYDIEVVENPDDILDLEEAAALTENEDAALEAEESEDDAILLEDEDVEIEDEKTEDEIELEEASSEANAKPREKASNVLSKGSGLANLYKAQTGENLPSYNWREYSEEEAPEETMELMDAGYDNTKEQLDQLDGVTVRLTFEPGEYKKEIKICGIDDKLSESEEQFIIVLQDEEGAALGENNNGYVNITDNDEKEDITYSFKEESVIVSPDETEAIVTVVRNQGINQMDFVTVGTDAEDAEAGVDYEAVYKELFFAAGVSEQTVTIPILKGVRDEEKHFYIGLAHRGKDKGQVGASCLVTIAKDDGAKAVEVNENVTPSEPSEAEFETVDNVTAAAGQYDEVKYNINKTWVQRDDFPWVDGYYDLSSASYVKVNFSTWGETWGLFINHKVKNVRVKMYVDNKTTGRTFYEEKDFSTEKMEEASSVIFYKGSDWSQYKNGGHIYAKVKGNSKNTYEGVSLTVKDIVVGYMNYEVKINNNMSDYNSYVEQHWTGQKTHSNNGNAIRYPQQYFNMDGTNLVTSKTFRCGSTVTMLRDTDTSRMGKNSAGIYPTEDTVEFKGFKLHKPGTTGELSSDIIQSGFRLDNAFVDKYKNYLWNDKTFVLVPIYEPKAVTVEPNRWDAQVSGGSEKGDYIGYKSGCCMDGVTKLDTITFKAGANAGYAITQIDINGKSDKSDSAYSVSRTNQNESDLNSFTTHLGDAGIKYYRTYLRFDNATLKIMADPAQVNHAEIQQGIAVYVDKTRTPHESTWQKPYEIKNVTMGTTYNVGSLVKKDSPYHAFWRDGTLDNDEDGEWIENHPTYHTFDPSIGSAISYTTKLPISRLYYSFYLRAEHASDPKPIASWLTLKDKLLLNPDYEISTGLNGATVYTDGYDSTTKYGGINGEYGDGFFYINPEKFLTNETYLISLNYDSYAGAINTNFTLHPGKYEHVNVNAWEDLNISNVVLYQEDTTTLFGDHPYKEVAVKGKCASSGYFTGLTDGDYNYRLSMNASKTGMLITKGELQFYDKTGSKHGSAVVVNIQPSAGGNFNFDFNPTKIGASAGDIAKVRFWDSAGNSYLQRDTGLKLTQSIGPLNVANVITAGKGSDAIDIIGSVASTLDIGWKGSFDKLDEDSGVTIDQNGNRVVKIGYTKAIVSKDTDKDKLEEAAKKMAKSDKAIGEKNKELEKTMEKYAGKGVLSEKEEKEIEEKRKAVDTAKKAKEDARKKYDDLAEAAHKPESKDVKMGAKLNMKLNFSFLMTFGYSDDDRYYFSNMIIAAKVIGDATVSVSYATPIGVTIGIALTINCEAELSFVIEERSDGLGKRYYLDENKDDFNIWDCDISDLDRQFDGYGAFNFTPSITLTLSAGLLGDLVSVSVSGTAAFNMVFYTAKAGEGSVTLNASIDVGVTIFHFKKELARKRFQMWGGDKDNNNVSALMQTSVMDALEANSYLYDGIENFQVEDVSFLNEEGEWFGEQDEEERLLSIDDEPGAYAEYILTNRIGPRPNFQMMELGKDRFIAVFLNVPIDRINDPENSRAVYYTIYENGDWSEPVMIEDDSELDYYPRVFDVGENALITWSSVSDEYKNTDNDVVAKQNGLDIHGVFLDKNTGKLAGDIMEITKTTKDIEKYQGTGLDFSDQISDVTAEVVSDDDSIIVYYSKKLFEAEKEASVGDALYPKYSIVAYRRYDKKTGEWVEEPDTNAPISALLEGLTQEEKEERTNAYKEMMYGQNFYSFYPDATILEEIDPDTGYLKEGTVTKLVEADNSSALMLDADAISYGDKGLFAYSLDLDGNLNTIADREIYLQEYDFTNDRMDECIILTGDSVEDCDVELTETEGQLWLSWLRDGDIVAMNLTHIMNNESKALIKGNYKYCYINKALPAAGAERTYFAPVPIVTGRKSQQDESGVAAMSSIDNFDVKAKNGILYYLWTEVSGELVDGIEKGTKEAEDPANAVTEEQMYCERVILGSLSDEGTDKSNIAEKTLPVQITSMNGAHYKDAAFDVMDDGKLIGVSYLAETRIITIDEAKAMNSDMTTEINEADFVPYPVEDITRANAVNFTVDTTSVPKIKNAGFVSADAEDGAHFAFEVLNDGFDTIENLTVRVTNVYGGTVIQENTLSNVLGGDIAAFSGDMELDEYDRDAKLLIELINDKNEVIRSEQISVEMEADLNLGEIKAEATDERGVYKISGTVTNDGNAKSFESSVRLGIAGELDKTLGSADVEPLLPKQSTEFTGYVELSDDMFEKTTDEDGNVTETVQLFANVTDSRVETKVERKAYKEEVATISAITDMTLDVAAAHIGEETATISEKQQVLKLSLGDSFRLTPEIESTLAHLDNDYIDEEGNVHQTQITGAEALKYRFVCEDGILDFSGEGIYGENNDGAGRVAQAGAGKLKVIAYYGDRERTVTNQSAGTDYFVHEYTSDGYSTIGSDAIWTKEFDVLVTKGGGSASESSFTDKNGIIYDIVDGNAYVVGLSEEAAGKLKSITIPATVSHDGKTYKVVKIDDGAFASNGQLQSVKIGKNVTEIGVAAFAGCTSLKSVSLGANVLVIGDRAFAGDAALKTVKLPKKLNTIGNGAFSNTGLTSITIPENVTSIGERAFYGSVSLKKVTIASSVIKDLGEDAFEKIADGAVFNLTMKDAKAKEELRGRLSGIFETFADKKGIVYEINDILDGTVKVIGLTDDAKSKLKKVSIPATVKYKGSSFKVTEIGEEAFIGSSLTGATIGKNVNYIMDRAFYGSKALKKVTLPKSLANIGEEAFAGTGLTGVKLPGRLFVIEEKAFAGCSKLKRVTITSNELIVVEDGAFDEIAKGAVFKINVKDIAEKKRIVKLLTKEGESFSDAKGVIYEVDSLEFGFVIATGLDEDAKKGLKTLNIPSKISYKGMDYKVLKIGDGAFSESAITSAKIGGNVLGIGDTAFKNCAALQKVTIGNSTFSIGVASFKGCASLEKITIPKSVVAIDAAAFEGAGKLKQITIKAPVLTEVVNGAFKDISANAVFKLSMNKKFKADIKKILEAAGVAKEKIK